MVSARVSGPASSGSLRPNVPARAEGGAARAARRATWPGRRGASGPVTSARLASRRCVTASSASSRTRARSASYRRMT